MKKVFLLLTMALCVVVGVNAQSAGKNNVAVYITGNVDNSNKEIISSKLVSRISNTKGYAAVERTEAFLNAITQESDYQVSGEVRDDQIAIIGKRFGATLVAVVDVNNTTEGSCFISARLIDVESGMVLKAVDGSRQISTTNELIALINNVAYRLMTKDSK